MTAHPSFAIPHRPRRTFDRAGRLSYEGRVLFRLEPDREIALEDVVDAVLESGPYRAGDFRDLPMVVYLVRDDESGDVFRVSIRDGAVRLHVLPETESGGLTRFYERLRKRSDCEWSIERRIEGDPDPE